MAEPCPCPDLASVATFRAVNSTVSLKLQADLAGNPKAEKLAAQAEKLLLRALNLVTNAENLLKPIPVP